MKAKDTVMNDKEIKKVLVFIGILTDARAIAKAQAEISFKAGIKEVVEFANHFAGIKHNPEWKAKKKEWGL